MKQRIISVILCMAILLTVFMSAPISVSAYGEDYDYEIDGVRYADIDDANVKIVGYNPDTLGENVVVPSTVYGKSVTQLEFPGFGDCHAKSIILPETLTSLDYYAFDSSFNLEKVTILGSIPSIKKFTFWHCKNLKEVNLPDSVEYISQLAFNECKSLESIVLPKNLKVIDSRVFEGCTSLKQVTINSQLEEIGSSAFANLGELTDVFFEERTKTLSIGHSAFANCPKLENFDFSYGCTMVSNTFENCVGLKSLVMSKDLIYGLGTNSFKGCTNLETVVLADNITSIPSGCFSGCTGLISVDSSTITSVGESAFSGCENLQNVSFAQNNNISNVSEYAFYNCYHLKEFNLQNAKYIYEKAFENCYNLFEVTVGEQLKEIKERAFFNCYSLSEIYIPDSVEYIGGMALACLEEDDQYYVFTNFTVIGSPDSLADEYAQGYQTKYALPAPKLTSISNTDSGVKVNFQKISGVSGKYRIYRKTAGTSWQSLADITTASYTDTTATAGTKYTYTVKFIGNDGTTSLYDKTGLTTTRMKTPSVTNISNTVEGAKITFGAVAGATKYRVYYKTSDGWKKIDDTEATSFVHTDAVSGTSYSYTVKAFDSDGAGSAHNSTGWNNKFIATPFIINAEVTNNGVKLTWNKVQGGEKFSYRVFVKNGSSWKSIGTVSGNTNIYTDKTVATGNSYTYTIRCVDSNNNYVSDFDSTGYTIRVLETPKGVSFENTYRGVVISWAEVQDAQNYRVYVKNGDSWSKLADTDATSYIHEGVNDSESYTYTVRCISSDQKVFESGFDSTGFTNTYKKPEIQAEIGDVDGDTQISVIDATAICLHLASIKVLTVDELARADADKDGCVSVMDATHIQLFLAGFIPNL